MESIEFKEFLNQYLTTALWSSTYGEDDTPIDAEHSTDHIEADSLEVLTAHAYSFFMRMYYYVEHEEGEQTLTQAGHHFWLTQNGHGAGFWDGDWPKYGDMLTKLSKCYPELNLSVQDGQVIAE